MVTSKFAEILPSCGEQWVTSDADQSLIYGMFALQNFKQPGEDEKEEERKKKATESLTEKTKKLDLKDEPQVWTEDKHCLWKVPTVNSCQIMRSIYPVNLCWVEC